jgi:hypothetical protein
MQQLAEHSNAAHVHAERASFQQQCLSASSPALLNTCRVVLGKPVSYPCQRHILDPPPFVSTAAHSFHPSLPPCLPAG